VLKAAGVRHIITSNLRRTSDTAAPLAKAAKLNPQVVPVERGRTPQHVEAVVEAVRLALRAAAVEPNAAVLVVGHSNTVPEIVKSLSGHDVGRQCEHQFAPLFIVTPARGSAPGRVVAARYGQPDSAPAPTPPGAEKPQCM
jgi:phosphohistidine phosphatase SixA